MVAAHVSKVSKDYSPYGYSVRRDLYMVLGSLPVPGAAGYPEQEVAALPIFADDDDIVIEQISIVPFVTMLGNGTQFWEIGVGVLTPPSSVTAPMAMVSNEGATPADDLAAFDVRRFDPVGAGAVVPRGSMLLAMATSPPAVPGSPDLPGFRVSIAVRYRRRA